MISFSQCKINVYCAGRRRKIIANYVTSGLGHQRVRKVLFTCMVHAISEFSLDKFSCSQEHSFFLIKAQVLQNLLYWS